MRETEYLEACRFAIFEVVVIFIGTTPKVPATFIVQLGGIEADGAAACVMACGKATGDALSRCSRDRKHALR